MSKMKYKRILLKLSGEVLGGSQGFGIMQDALDFYTNEVISVAEKGIQTGVVIGGGNIFRGAELIGEGFIDRAQGDYMGMLATVINGIALETSLKNKGYKTRLITAFKIEKVGEHYNQNCVTRYLDEGYILIFTGGTSNPYFTTDSAAALRGAEIGADAILKGTKVDGVYSDDPVKKPDAEFFRKISFEEVIRRELKVMDMTAFAVCKENKIPIHIFNSTVKGNLLKLIQGGDVGTLVS